MARRTIFAVLIALSLAQPVNAQVNRNAIPNTDALAFLIGDWEGDAWSTTREGRVTMWQTEHVEKRLDGAILLIEGTGRSKDEDGVIGEVLFNAFGVISPADSLTFRLASWLSDGRSGEYVVKPTKKGFVWTIPTPYGTTRYTQEITKEGEWLEYGEFSRDEGKTWMKIMEMRLQKVSK